MFRDEEGNEDTPECEGFRDSLGGVTAENVEECSGGEGSEPGEEGEVAISECQP